jgi:hypothetical protein
MPPNGARGVMGRASLPCNAITNRFHRYGTEPHRLSNPVAFSPPAERGIEDD